MSPRHPTMLVEEAKFSTPSFTVEEQKNQEISLMISGKCVTNM